MRGRVNVPSAPDESSPRGPDAALRNLHSRSDRMMRMRPHRSHTRLSCVLFALLGLVAASADAQYMYLDSNGDGVHTSSDVVSPSGTTTFDVWIRTNANRDGTSAICSSGDGPLDIRSYQFILHASEGTVSWGAYTNAQPQAFPSTFGSEFDTTDAFVS